MNNWQLQTVQSIENSWQLRTPDLWKLSWTWTAKPLGSTYRAEEKSDRHFNEAKTVICAICLDSLQKLVKLPCSHEFCSNCVDALRSHRTLPRRTKIPQQRYQNLKVLQPNNKKNWSCIPNMTIYDRLVIKEAVFGTQTASFKLQQVVDKVDHENFPRLIWRSTWM